VRVVRLNTVTEPDKMHAELRALRARIAKLEARGPHSLFENRVSALAVMLAGCLLVLTAVTWAVDTDYDETYTLWGLVSDGGWFALVTLALVFIHGVGSALAFVGGPSTRPVHITFVVLGLVTAAGTLFVGVPEDSETAPGRWLALLAAVALAGLHGGRAGDLRYPEKS
jgi:hypothetical protein